jgi:hypothetical protein
MKLLLPLGAVVALALGCPTPPPPAVDAGQVEADCVVDTNFPNQDAESADDITPGTPVQGTLCPARDDDGYRVHAAAGDVIVVTLSMDTNITNVTPAYGLLLDNGDGSMTPLGIFDVDANDSQGHAVNFTSAHRVDVEGDYIVDVRDSEGLDDGFDNFNKYTLLVNVVADPDANEPNNTPPQATPVVAGTPINGQIATSGDQDWYAIDVAGTAQIIDVAITVPINSGIEHQATLFAPDGITVLQTTPFTRDDSVTPATQEIVRIRKAASHSDAGPFLLLVQDRSGGAGDTDQDAQLDPALAQYTLTLTLIADPDPNEGAAGNDTIATATTVTSGASLAASLPAFADQDIYRITPPGGTTANTPKVLVVTITFDGALSNEFKPQVKLVTADPEEGAPKPCAQVNNACEGVDPGNDHVHSCYDGKCGTEMLQRFIQTSPFKTAFPLRSTEPVFVEVNEFNDDAFQETGGYQIDFEIVNDPDAGEHGDDFLIPNLEFAGFANGNELSNQRDQSRDRARQLDLGYSALCPHDLAAATATNDGPGGCIDMKPVVDFVDFGFDSLEADCSDSAAGTVSKTFSGALSYEGDRDYFMLNNFPDGSYWGIDVTYTINTPNGSTPVELAVFVHGNGGELAGSTLEAQQTGQCREQDGGQNACAADSICVDERCWTDGAGNPAHTVDFGDGPDECVVAFQNVSRPVYIEVVDNGINDFDLDMTYSLTVTVSCGCPASCDTGEDFCQDG